MKNSRAENRTKNSRMKKSRTGSGGSKITRMKARTGAIGLDGCVECWCRSEQFGNHGIVATGTIIGYDDHLSIGKAGPDGRRIGIDARIHELRATLQEPK